MLFERFLSFTAYCPVVDMVIYNPLSGLLL